MWSFISALYRVINLSSDIPVYQNIIIILEPCSSRFVWNISTIREDKGSKCPSWLSEAQRAWDNPNRSVFSTHQTVRGLAINLKLEWFQRKKLEQTEIYRQMIHFPLAIWLYPECKLWDIVGSPPTHTSLQPKIYPLNGIIYKICIYNYMYYIYIYVQYLYILFFYIWYTLSLPIFPPPEHPYSSLLTLSPCRYPPPRYMLSCHQHQLHRYRQWVDHVLLPSGWHLPDPRCHNKQLQRIHLNRTNDGARVSPPVPSREPRGCCLLTRSDWCWEIFWHQWNQTFFGYLELRFFHEC